MTEPSFLPDTRASYDAVAAAYAERFRDGLAGKPLDRAVLAGFAELVLAGPSGTVADVGCGPGDTTAHLRGLGLDTFGVDLSPGMVAVARRDHPGLRFVEGSMLALDMPDGALGGVVAFYSTIHLPPERLPTAFAEFHRVLAPGGQLLVAFQVGEGINRATGWLGHPVSMSLYRRQPEQVAELVALAGLVPHARLLREPDDDGVEGTARAYLLARKPGEASR